MAHPIRKVWLNQESETTMVKLKMMERRTEKAGAVSGNMQKVLEHLLIGKIGKGTVKILLIQSGILLLAMESSWMK